LAAEEVTFKLSRPVGSSTLREHLEADERRTGKRAWELDECKIPKEALHIWRWFLELDATRQNGMDINPISYSEIAAWSKLTGNRPRRHEVEVLRQIDGLYLAEHAERAKKK
jgi:hypothetical protein